EELAEQRLRVERARTWRDRAQQDLTRSRQATDEELAVLDKMLDQCRAEVEAAQDARARVAKARPATSESDYGETEKRLRVGQARYEQVQAERRARQAKGTLVAEDELARREKELAEAQAALRLLEAGTRPEEIEAEAARLARLQEEQRY